MTHPLNGSPAVSVVIPTFNRPSSTERAVRSVLDQTALPREIVIVDDASERPFVWSGADRAETEIRVLRHDRNLGAAAARQTGIAAARGALIAFLDSDDVWAPDKLRAQLAVLADEEDGSGDDLTVAVCGWNAVPEPAGTSRQRVPVASASVLDFASGCWFSPGTTALVPRTAFDVVGPIDGRLRRLEDLDWFLRFALAGGRVVVAPVIGATISIGRRGRLKDIDDAARIILSKLDRVDDAARARALRTRLMAYLDLERANSAFAERRILETVGYMARSLARHPRLGIPLKPWWIDPAQDRQMQEPNDVRL